MGRHHMKGGAEFPLTDRWYCLEQWSNITPSLRRTFRDYINWAQKSCQEHSSVMIWTGDLMVADMEELQEMDASEIHARRLNAKGSVKADERWQFYFPSRRWNSQNTWRRSTSETIHLDQGSSWIEERNKKFFEESHTDSLLQILFKMTLHWMKRKRKMISGLLRETSFIAITWNPESNCAGRKKNHFAIPLQYIDVTRTTHTSLDIFVGRTCWWLQQRGWEKENYEMHGLASQKLFYWTKDHLTEFSWCGWRLTKKQTQDPTM